MSFNLKSALSPSHKMLCVRRCVQKGNFFLRTPTDPFPSPIFFTKYTGKDAGDTDRYDQMRIPASTCG